jgi:signal transduction histidine kinase
MPATAPASGIHHAGLTLLRGLWWTLVPLAMGLTLAGIPARLRHLAGVGNPPQPVHLYNLALEVLLALIFFAMALFIVRRHWDEPLALFMSLTLVMLGATETGMTDSLINPEFSSVAAWWRSPVLLFRALAMIGALLLFYLFPDGRFVPRFTRWLALAWATLTLIWLLFPQVPLNTIYGPTWRATPIASYLFAVAWFATGIAAQIYRHRRVSGHVERQQTEWMAAGLISAMLGGVAYYGISVIDNTLWPSFLGPAYEWVRPTLRAVLMALLPICIAVAILRYRLFDIDLLIEGTLLYGALSATIVVLYVVVVATVGAMVGSRNSFATSLLATAVVALLFQPLRSRLQRGVNRLLYGERDDPYAVLTRLGRDIGEGVPSPDTLLASIAQTVAEALRLPYAELVTHDPRGAMQRATFGSAPQPDRLLTLPLSYLGEEVGSLVVATRSAREPLSPGDRRLLADLARQAAISVYAAQVSRDLHQSRGALITAREEERRRLRRDLHDGLGPSLAGLSFRIDAARNLLKRDPARADGQLEAAGDQLRTAIADIRRLVYDLRPPALDELGLVAALRQHVETVQPGTVQLRLEAPEDLPPLPAAVEVAAYRIVQEAMTNVLRHAHARTGVARLAIEQGVFVISIVDDGRGLPPDVRSGVGMSAMRERAAELGGALEVSSVPDGGTRVVARLPLRPSQAPATAAGPDSGEEGS